MNKSQEPHNYKRRNQFILQIEENKLINRKHRVKREKLLQKGSRENPRPKGRPPSFLQWRNTSTNKKTPKFYPKLSIYSAYKGYKGKNGCFNPTLI